jgi:uncharacterized phage protein (TIGR01671 family)
MRELKFRGKRQFGSTDGWHYGRIEKYKPDIPSPDSYDMPVIDGALCDPDTVGQCTEWQDMDGTEIYEDDIVELVNEDGDTVQGVIEYGTYKRTMATGYLVEITGFCIMMDGRASFPIVKNYQGKHDLDIMKVVGNLHDGMGG